LTDKPPITPARRAQLAKWSGQAIARFEEMKTVGGLWRFIDSICDHRRALRAEALDLDQTVGVAAREAYERLTGRTLAGLPIRGDVAA